MAKRTFGKSSQKFGKNGNARNFRREDGRNSNRIVLDLSSNYVNEDSGESTEQESSGITYAAGRVPLATLGELAATNL